MRKYADFDCARGYRAYPNFVRPQQAQSLEGLYAGLDELNLRLTRIETKLCAYFEHTGFDANAHIASQKAKDENYVRKF